MNKLVVRALRLLLPLALLLVVLRLLDGGDGVAPKAETPDDAAAPADPVEGAGAADIPFIRAPDRNKEAYFKLKEQRIARGRRRRQQRDAERESSKTRSDYWKPPADAVLRARWKRRLMEDCEGVEDEGFMEFPEGTPPGPQLFNRLLLRTRCRYIRLHARLPPPGFDGWVAWADKHQCELDHYPAIERDLKPYRIRYRGRADLLRKVVGAMMEQEEHAKHYLRIRNGSVYTWGEGAEVTKVPIAKFAWALPDMDMIVNWLDEPRVLAWDQSQSELTDDEAAELERKVDYLYNLSTIRMFHDDRSKPVPAPPAVSRTSEEEEVIKAYADQKTASAEGWTRADPDLPPLPYDPMKPLPYYDFAAMDIRDVLRDRCPPLREHPAADKAMSLHGFFLAPTSFKPIYHLVPVFTATKPVLGSRGTIHDADAVSCFQDIIIPNHLSLRTKTPPGHNLQPWDKRKEKLIWRGRSTGGQLTYEAPWRNFQRPRAVEYSNKRMAMGDERIDLQFTDVIQCDDGRGGRGGYFDKIDFDYQAEGDEEALERLGEDMRIEAKRRRVSMSHTENDKGNVTYEAGVPEGRDEGEWERDKVSQRIKSALEKLRKANEAKAPAGDAASGTEGGNDEDDGDFEDDGEEEGPEDGPVIENQGPKRRLRKRDGEAEQAPAPAAAPKKGKKASSNEPAGAPQKVVGRFKASGKVTAPKKQKDTVKSAANKKSSGPKKDLIPANATAGMKHPPRPPAPPPPARRKKSSSSDVKKRVNMCSLIKNFYGIGGWMSTSDCMNHKYLFDVDGNTWSQRFESFLWGGSLVFRMSLFSNWFDQYILPDVHYVHLNVTLADLEERLEWAMKHDAEAQAMAERALAVAQTRLRIVDMECYIYRLLLEYSQIGDEVWLNDD